MNPHIDTICLEISTGVFLPFLKPMLQSIITVLAHRPAQVLVWVLLANPDIKAAVNYLVRALPVSIVNLAMIMGMMGCVIGHATWKDILANFSRRVKLAKCKLLV